MSIIATRRFTLQFQTHYTLQRHSWYCFLESKLLPATLSPKQLKHTFWEDDLIIPGLRLQNQRSLIH